MVSSELTMKCLARVSVPFLLKIWRWQPFLPSSLETTETKQKQMPDAARTVAVATLRAPSLKSEIWSFKEAIWCSALSL